MIPDSLRKELRAIQTELSEYQFAPYPHPLRSGKLQTPEKLSECTGCGPAAAQLVLNIFPRQQGEFHLGEGHFFNNHGLDMFIHDTSDWASIFIKQGFAPVLSDTGGNIIFVPVSAESLDPVVLAATDVAWESEDITEMGCVYLGSLSALLRKQANDPGYEMFRHTGSWRAFSEKKAHAKAAWAAECRRRAGISFT